MGYVRPLSRYERLLYRVIARLERHAERLSDKAWKKAYPANSHKQEVGS